MRSLFSAVILSFFVLVNRVQAQPSDADPAQISDLNIIFASVVRAIIAFAAVASLGMLVYGGYRYLSAGTDKQSTTQAQQTITFALGGLLVTLSAWIILNLVGTFFGVNLSVFDICIEGTSCT